MSKQISSLSLEEAAKRLKLDVIEVKACVYKTKELKGYRDDRGYLRVYLCSIEDFEKKLKDEEKRK